MEFIEAFSVYKFTNTRFLEGLAKKMPHLWGILNDKFCGGKWRVLVEN